MDNTSTSVKEKLQNWQMNESVAVGIKNIGFFVSKHDLT